MQFLPFQRVTLVSAHSAEEIFVRLRTLVRPPEVPRTYTVKVELTVLTRKTNETYLYEGWLKAPNFQIYQHFNYPEHFNPLIVGRVEPTSRGCILFIKYQLPKGTLFILILGLLIFLALLLVFCLVEQNLMSGGLTLLFLLGIYSVVMLNFQQKVKNVRRIFEKLLFEY